MGLLDAEYKITAVLDEEYFLSHGWCKQDNYIIGHIDCEKSTSWLKMIIDDSKQQPRYMAERLWIRYDERNKNLYNLYNGKRFKTDDVWVLENTIEEWVSNFKGV